MKKYRHTINVLLVVLLMMIILSFFAGLFWYGGSLEFNHYVGITAVSVTFITLFINQNLFTLLTGITLLIGNFGGFSFLFPVETYFLGFHIGPLPIPLYWGQPFYSLLLVIYLIFNKEFYIGIATKEYWQGFLKRTKDLEQIFVIVNKGHTEQQTNDQP